MCKTLNIVMDLGRLREIGLL